MLTVRTDVDVSRAHFAHAHLFEFRPENTANPSPNFLRISGIIPKYKVLLDAWGLKFERVLPTHSPFQIIEASKK